MSTWSQANLQQPKPIKGKGHQMNIFWNAYKMKSVLSVHAQIVFKFLACPVQDKNKFKFSACFFETLTKFKTYFESLIKILFRLSFALIARFSPVYIHAGFRNNIQDHGRSSKQLLESQAAIRKPEQASCRGVKDLYN